MALGDPPAKRADEGEFVEGIFPRDIWEMTREEWLDRRSFKR